MSEVAGWVKCSDAMPEFKTLVILYDGKMKWIGQRYKTNPNSTAWVWKLSGCTTPYRQSKFSHWMLIPKPPEKEK